MTWKAKGPIETPYRSRGAPQAFGNRVVFHAVDSLSAWDMARKEEVWQAELPERHRHARSVSCGGLYVTFAPVTDKKKPQRVFAVDPATGATVWETLVEAHCSGYNRGMAASKDAVFFYGSYKPDEEYNLIKLDAQSGQVIWKRPVKTTQSIHWQDGHLFFSGWHDLVVLDEEGEQVYQFEQRADAQWSLTPAVDHTMLAKYRDPKTQAEMLMLIDTRTLEVLAQMEDPAESTVYGPGRRRGQFAGVDDKKLVVIDVLEGRHICDRFTDACYWLNDVAATSDGYAVLHSDESLEHTHITWVDEATGELLDTIELGGFARKLLGLSGRLIGSVSEDLYFLEPA